VCNNYTGTHNFSYVAFAGYPVVNDFLTWTGSVSGASDGGNYVRSIVSLGVTNDTSATIPIISFQLPTPINQSHVNNGNVFFNISINSVVSLCNLTYNGVLVNMINVSSTSFYYNKTSSSDGNYTYYATCDGINSTTQNYYVDTANPQITWYLPNLSNIPDIRNLSINVSGNDTNLYAYLINVTNSSGGLLYNVTAFNITNPITINHTMNISLNDTYNITVCLADSHTDNILSSEIFINNVSKEDKEISFKLGIENIKVELQTTSNIDKLVSVSTDKLIDRFTFNYEYPKQEIKTLNTYNFRVFSSLQAYEIKNSKYKAHIVLGKPFIDLNAYWMDFQTDNQNDIIKIDKIEYPFIYVSVQSYDTKLNFHSLGGLNEICESRLFNNYCVSSWSAINEQCINDLRFTHYSDSNACFYPSSIPANNNTYVNCTSVQTILLTSINTTMEFVGIAILIVGFIIYIALRKKKD
jgi:hypothetical protein